MSMASGIEPRDTVSAIARCRYVLLKRADELLGDNLEADSHDALPGVSALLMTSLEQLKVAEEELRIQNTMLESQRAASEEQVRHYRQLFWHSPAPSLVTDVYGTIHEVNLATAALFRREVRQLERKPFATLLATEFRDEFRRQLVRVSAGDCVRDWQLVIKRVGDLPLHARATVKFIPDLGTTGSGLLYWMLGVPDQQQ